MDFLQKLRKFGRRAVQVPVLVPQDLLVLHACLVVQWVFLLGVLLVSVVCKSTGFSMVCHLVLDFRCLLHIPSGPLILLSLSLFTVSMARSRTMASGVHFMSRKTSSRRHSCHVWISHHSPQMLIRADTYKYGISFVYARWGPTSLQVTPGQNCYHLSCQNHAEFSCVMPHVQLIALNCHPFHTGRYEQSVLDSAYQNWLVIQHSN